MFWDQQLTVYTDQKNLMQDALGLTSDWVYHWTLLLEEYGPTIVHIKGIHNKWQIPFHDWTMEPAKRTGRL
jgi:hypothetical protein